MESFETRLKNYLGITEEEFAWRTREPSFSDMPLIKDKEAVGKAKSRLHKAVKNGEKILIYGDYDCDGIMATSIMTRVLASIGANVTHFIPSRYVDGYGLSPQRAKEIAESDIRLVLTVDNGITAFEGIDILKEAGVAVIVLDHHEIGDHLPNADLILHPVLLGLEKLPISAGCLSFLFGSVLLKEYDPYLAVLGALSTISDCMPVFGYNQKLIALALRFIRKYKYPTIISLTSSRRIDEVTLGMEIVPAINAVGRMEEGHEAQKLIPYFAFGKGIEEVSSYMLETNKSRKAITKNAEAELIYDQNAPGILALVNLPEGLNGLLANRLLSKHSRPVAVLSKSKEDPTILIGSLRAKKGFNFIDFLTELGPLAVRGGGHELAGGISIYEKDYEAFKEAFLSFCALHPCIEEKEDAMDIVLEDISMESFRFLRVLGPFGHGNEGPRFRLSHFPVSSLRFSRDENHIMVFLPNGNKIVGFYMGKDCIREGTEYLALEGKLTFDEFRGKASIAFQADKLYEEDIA